MNENHRVILVQKDRYLVRGADEELYCVLAGSLRYQDEFPVVGDYVEVIANPYGDSLIRAIQPRKTVFCRPDRGGHADGFVKTVKVQPLVANIDVGEIREKDSKGRHTTTQRQLIEIDGVSFIDTPGLRELGVIDAGEGIADTFSDIAELTEQCAFSNCTHRTEPGCAIRRALEDGSLSRERWEMYARLERENQWSMDKKNELMVSVAKHRRELNRSKGKR